ncbi:hypothetical protein HDU83_004586 [Entophlyctis luteolus]|nr:hypothetical protein HDU83_004586 [Entophlyctis luteolus]
MEEAHKDTHSTLVESIVTPEAPLRHLHEPLPTSINSPPALKEDPAFIHYHQMTAYLQFMSMQSAFPMEAFFPFAFPVVYENIAPAIVDPSYFMHADATVYSGEMPHELLANHGSASPESATVECLHMDQPLLFPLLTHQLHYETPEGSELMTPYEGNSESAISLMGIADVKTDAPPEVATAPATSPKSPKLSKKKLPLRLSGAAVPKQKSRRFKANEDELKFLMSVFESNPFPNAKMRQFISKKVGMSDKQVVVWFQNKRANCKVNGIVAVKPKKGDLAATVTGNLVQVSLENPFFFTKA